MGRDNDDSFEYQARREQHAAEYRRDEQRAFLRANIAGQVMAAYIGRAPHPGQGAEFSEWADYSVRAADALLAALEAKP